jgi:hypothetical protein
VIYEAILSDEARAFLLQLPPDGFARVQGCIAALERNPYPPSAYAIVLKSGSRIWPSAYFCGPWGIGFYVDGPFVVIEAIDWYRH